VLARHRGAHRYTVGQRRGIGVAAPEPLYVLRTDGDRVVVGPREELATRTVALRGARLHRDGAAVDRVKLRYRSRAVECRVAGPAAAGAHRTLALELAEPVDGAAPGQTACLLAGDVVVGWATVARA
jgi:tRNA-uridine 2-sulfurtransferase